MAWHKDRTLREQQVIFSSRFLEFTLFSAFYTVVLKCTEIRIVLFEWDNEPSSKYQVPNTGTRTD